MRNSAIEQESTPFSHFDIDSRQIESDYAPVRLSEDLREFGGTTLSVGILLWPDFTLLALAGFIDALRLAGDIGDRSRQILCRWSIMSATPGPIGASSGVKVTPSAGLVDARRFNYIVVVAGRTERIEEAPSANFDYIKNAARIGVPLIGLGTGSFVLAHPGLLDGYTACIANYHYREFAERFPKIPVVYDQLFCIDKDRTTCAGGAASIDLATHLVKQHCGSDRALKVCHTMIVDTLRRPNSAQRILRTSHDRIAHPRLSRAIGLMEQHVSRPIPIRKIAKLVQTSERQLERAFAKELDIAPSSYFLRLRLQHGHWLLSNTAITISQIAYDCGFADNSHFTRAFKQEFYKTPSQVRSEASMKSS
jgi:transcriptional regulator GlxA family with amidase domain